MYETAMYEWRFPGSRRWRAGAGRILLVEIGCDGSVISAGRTDDRTVRPRAREAEVVGDEEIRVLCAHGGKQGGLGGAGERKLGLCAKPVQTTLVVVCCLPKVSALGLSLWARSRLAAPWIRLV
ncbi:hypothetical protein FOZ63_029149, partial [Perkinsus olseni]